MNVRMTSNLFRAARMGGVLIPAIGNTVVLSEADAKRLIELEHAEPVDAEVEPAPVTPVAETKPEPKHDPMTKADTADKPAEKRGPGRPPKAKAE